MSLNIPLSLGEDVSAVACGPEHIVVVGGKGDVYAWGKGEGGRLGLDSEEDVCSPCKVKIDTEQVKNCVKNSYRFFLSLISNSRSTL